MNPPPRHEEALFHAAARLSGSARAAFLDGACRGDDPLRRRLEALLAAHDTEDSFLEPAAPKASDRASGTIKARLPQALDEAAGTPVGRYNLMEKVRKGGCGVVYVAEQTEPVRRLVALIHRDIKPSKTAVSRHDGVPVSKVAATRFPRQPPSGISCGFLLRRTGHNPDRARNHSLKRNRLPVTQRRIYGGSR